MAKKRENDCNNGPVTVCPKESTLGKMEARIEHNESADKELRDTFQKFLDANTKEREETNKRFSDMTVEISKMSTAVQQSAESTKAIMANQNSMMEKMEALLLENRDLNNNYANIQAEIDKIKEVAQTRYDKIKGALEAANIRIGDFEKRVSPLEYHRTMVISIAGAVISILIALGSSLLGKLF